MSYDICKRCEKFFDKNGNKYCEKCGSELEESFSKINKHLEENPNASILEIVKNTGVKLRDINLFLDQGGASIVDYSYKPINLRQEQIKKQEEITNKKEKIKIKNKFEPRRLRK